MRHHRTTWIGMSAAAVVAGAVTAGTLVAIASAGADEPAPPTPAAGVASVRTLSTGLAQQAAEVTLADCTAKGHHVSVAVVGRDNALVVLLRDEQAGPVTVEVATGKARASVGFRAPSGNLGQAAQTNPGILQVPGFVVLAGGLPISSGGDVVGAIGVSGAPGGDIDAGCAQAGIDAIADAL
jgi:uncharacterized protein GlcG (DUF336 family)